ncbi:phosphatidylglycerol lysyltransferase [Microbacterium proteolyticum]|nr:phosphatidylglycerol lysyltransferase [Microbacterium proteolyticum]
MDRDLRRHGRELLTVRQTSGARLAGRRQPLPFVACTLAAVVVGVSLVSMNADAFRSAGSFDLRAILLTLVRVDDPLSLFVVGIAVLLVCGWAERLMGGARTLLAYAVGGVVTSVAGLTVGAGESHLFPTVPLGEMPVTGASPLPALLVVAMAASCFAGALWRRRVRGVCLLLAVTMFLYSASASDLFALLALPVGLGLGMLAGGQRATMRVQRSSRHEVRVLLCALTAITAMGPIVATLWGSGAGLLSVYGWLSYDPIVVADGVVCVAGSALVPCPDAASFSEVQAHAGWIAVLPLLVLLVAAWGILRGQLAALGVAMAVNMLIYAGMSALFIVWEPDTLALLARVRGTDADGVWQTLVGFAVGAVVPLGVAVTLFLSRRAVSVAPTSKALRTFLTTVALAAAATVAVSFAGGLAAADHFSPRLTPETLWRDAPLRLLPPSLVPGEWVHAAPATPLAQALWYLPPLVFWLVCVAATVRLVMRPQSVRADEDRARVREMVQRGCGSLGFMATWPGNAYWFAPGADAGFAYRPHGGVAVTLGGAFGGDRGRPEIGAAFVEFCGDNGWTPVFYSVDDAAADALGGLGWQRTRVADEAILDPQTWTPAGKKRQDVRTATNRAQREGVLAQWVSWGTLALGDRVQIREISEGWVADKSVPEMGFTLGTVDEAADPAARLMLARDASGRIIAVTTWIPAFGAHGLCGYTLDVMRRRHDAMNGVVEFLVGAAVEQLRADGCTMLSLSGSPLAPNRVDDGEAPSAVDRLLETSSWLLEPAYGFRSLAAFKKKFQPDLRPLWMVYPDATHLPAVALALLRCYVPGLDVARAARLAARMRRSRRSSIARV